MGGAWTSAPPTGESLEVRSVQRIAAWGKGKEGTGGRREGQLCMRL